MHSKEDWVVFYTFQKNIGSILYPEDWSTKCIPKEDWIVSYTF
jgi:hypothetical protein